MAARALNAQVRSGLSWKVRDCHVAAAALHPPVLECRQKAWHLILAAALLRTVDIDAEPHPPRHCAPASESDAAALPQLEDPAERSVEYSQSLRATPAEIRPRSPIDRALARKHDSGPLLQSEPILQTAVHRRGGR